MHAGVKETQLICVGTNGCEGEYCGSLRKLMERGTRVRCWVNAWYAVLWFFCVVVAVVLCKCPTHFIFLAGEVCMARMPLGKQCEERRNKLQKQMYPEIYPLRKQTTRKLTNHEFKVSLFCVLYLLFTMLSQV